MFIYLFSLDLLTVLFLYIYIYSPGLRLDLWRLVSAHTCPLSRVSFAEASPCCCIWWAKRSICSSRLPQRGLRSRTSTHPPTLLTRSECHRVRYSHSLQLSNDQVRAYNLQMRLGRALRATLSFTLGRQWCEMATFVQSLNGGNLPSVAALGICAGHVFRPT